jgi:hypothetical protein
MHQVCIRKNNNLSLTFKIRKHEKHFLFASTSLYNKGWF